jgi:hypothetical protein
MPVTSRKLLVANISGAGKKAPNNLRFDPIIRQVVNINCGICNLVPQSNRTYSTGQSLDNAGCKGSSCYSSVLPHSTRIYPTGQFFGNAVCKGSSCYASALPNYTGARVLAIPDTTYVLQSGLNLFIINASQSNVYWTNDYGTSTPQLILPGHAAITNPGSLYQVTYTFSS